jgi:hypothetical protein
MFALPDALTNDTAPTETAVMITPSVNAPKRLNIMF